MSLGMVANIGPGKTEMVVIRHKLAVLSQRSFGVAGKCIAVVNQYRYLGTIFYEFVGIKVDLAAR